MVRRILLVLALILAVGALAALLAVPASANNPDPGEVMVHVGFKFVGQHETDPPPDTWGEIKAILKDDQGQEVDSKVIRVTRFSATAEWSQNAWGFLNNDGGDYTLAVEAYNEDGSNILDVWGDMSLDFTLVYTDGADIHVYYIGSWNTPNQAYYMNKWYMKDCTGIPTDSLCDFQ